MKRIVFLLFCFPLHAMQKEDSSSGDDIKVTIMSHAHSHKRHSLDDELKNYIEARIASVLQEKEAELNKHKAIIDEEVRRSRIIMFSTVGTALLTTGINLIMNYRSDQG